MSLSDLNGVDFQSPELAAYLASFHVSLSVYMGCSNYSEGDLFVVPLDCHTAYFHFLAHDTRFNAKFAVMRVIALLLKKDALSVSKCFHNFDVSVTRPLFELRYTKEHRIITTNHYEPFLKMRNHLKEFKTKTNTFIKHGASGQFNAAFAELSINLRAKTKQCFHGASRCGVDIKQKS